MRKMNGISTSGTRACDSLTSFTGQSYEKCFVFFLFKSLNTVPLADHFRVKVLKGKIVQTPVVLADRGLLCSVLHECGGAAGVQSSEILPLILPAQCKQQCTWQCTEWVRSRRRVQTASPPAATVPVRPSPAQTGPVRSLRLQAGGSCQTPQSATSYGARCGPAPPLAPPAGRPPPRNCTPLSQCSQPGPSAPCAAGGPGRPGGAG